MRPPWMLCWWYMRDGKAYHLLLIRKNVQIADTTYNPKNLKRLIVLGVGRRWTANEGVKNETGNN